MSEAPAVQLSLFGDLFDTSPTQAPLPITQTEMPAPMPLLDSVNRLLVTPPQGDLRVKSVRSVVARTLAGRAFQVNTVVSSEFLALLQEWIEEGSHGALVYGRPRLGKTCGSRWALKQLSRLIGCHIPCYEVPVRRNAADSDRSFYQHVLSCVGHRHPSQGTNPEKKDRLSRFLISKATRSELKTVVLLWDEAQLLSDADYLRLLTLGNELDKEGCRLFCLLVGQPELEGKKKELIESGMEQFVSRYMVREMEFRGLCSEEEVASCLAGFDSTEYPPGQGTRFPEHFIPEACEQGFHLENLAPFFWKHFGSAWAESLPGPVEIPMSNLVYALIKLLRACFRGGVHPSSGLVEKAVQGAGYAETLAIRKAAAAQITEEDSSSGSSDA